MSDEKLEADLSDRTRETKEPPDSVDIEEVPAGLLSEPSPFAQRRHDPVAFNDRMRGIVALTVLGLLGTVVAGSFVLLATNSVSIDELEGLLTIVFAPLVALAGSATGFYFGGRNR